MEISFISLVPPTSDCIENKKKAWENVDVSGSSAALGAFIVGFSDARFRARIRGKWDHWFNLAFQSSLFSLIDKTNVEKASVTLKTHRVDQLRHALVLFFWRVWNQRRLLGFVERSINFGRSSALFRGQVFLIMSSRTP
jgi:hypothetical protein